MVTRRIAGVRMASAAGALTLATGLALPPSAAAGVGDAERAEEAIAKALGTYVDEVDRGFVASAVSRRSGGDRNGPRAHTPIRLALDLRVPRATCRETRGARVSCETRVPVTVPTTTTTPLGSQQTGTTTTQVPIEVRVRWIVRTAPQGPAIDGSALLGEEARIESPLGLFGLASFNPTLVFSHVLTQFPQTVAPARFVSAEVSFVARPSQASPPVRDVEDIPRALRAPDVPDIRVPMLAVPVPRMLALFEDPDFKGSAMVMVPDNPSGPAARPEAQESVRRVFDEVNGLRGDGLFPVYSSLGLLVPPELRNLDDNGYKLVHTELVKNLNNVKLEGTLSSLGNLVKLGTEAEDEISAVMAIGLPITRMRMTSNRRQTGAALEVRTLSGAVALPNTHFAPPRGEPRRAIATFDKRGVAKPVKFADNLSSARIFAPEPPARFSRTGRLSRTRRSATLSGPLRCPAGDRTQVIVRLTQRGGRRVAEGATVLRCPRAAGRWSARAELVRGGPLAAGAARACALLTSRDRRGDTSHREAWCARRVTLRR
jgi:hypothetical protein